MAPDDGTSVSYAIDPRASQFTVQAFASGLISAVAHSPKVAVREWSADVRFVPETLKDARLSVSIRANSLEVLDSLRDSDRRELHRVMNDEVLESGRFPEVTFESAGIAADRLKENLFRVNVGGRLSLHGVSNSQMVTAPVAFGVDTFRGFGEFTLLQTDYGLRGASIAGGTLKFEDQIKCNFYGIGRKGR